MTSIDDGIQDESVNPEDSEVFLSILWFLLNRVMLLLVMMM